MAVTIDWGTSVITVPKSDLTLIQASPTEIREMGIDWFRLALKDLEDSEDGLPFPITHNHNTEVSLGGLTYARVVEILDPYTITFEDGQYAVNLTGANSNIADRVNVNQVSVRSANSAGLISSPEIQFSTFGGRVTVDVNSGFSGTVFPLGTPLKPVNNLDDALVIAAYRGLSVIHTHAELTIEATHVLDEMTVRADNWAVVTVEAGASIVNTNFEKASLRGVMGGFWNVLIDCWVYDVTNFCGWVRGGSIVDVALAAYTVESAGQSYFDDLEPMYPGQSSSIVMNTNTAVAVVKNRDIVTIKSLTAGSTVVCGTLGGSFIIDASCTGGAITVSGVGALTNNSALVPNADGLVNAASSWEQVIESGLNAKQYFRMVGRSLAAKATGGGSTEIEFYNLAGTQLSFRLNIEDQNGNRAAPDIIDLD